MSNNVHNHEAYETIHKSENTSYVSQTTPNSVNTECELPAPAKYVVPIIFIPGIMGSNIMDTKKNKVWYPKVSISTIRIALRPTNSAVCFARFNGEVKIKPGILLGSRNHRLSASVLACSIPLLSFKTYTLGAVSANILSLTVSLV